MTASKGTVKWKTLETDSSEEKERTGLQSLGNAMPEEKPEDYPEGEDWKSGQDYYYIDHLSGSNDSVMLKEMILSYGAIDEEIRSDGKYVIEYNYKTATVYGVFYSGSEKELEYSNLIKTASIRTEKNVRKNYKDGIIGYYGGATKEELEVSKEAISATLEVKNEDRLQVIVHTEEAANVLITIIGEESGAKKQFFEDELNKTRENGAYQYVLTLDDLSEQGQHFIELANSEEIGTFLTSGLQFIAGENITVSATATSKTRLAPLANIQPVITKFICR